ncbi:MAG: hypothetical protein GY720_07665, partial [bacterium]|nr:hypothetical protein [bacterium]
LMAAVARPAGAADMEWDGDATPNTWGQVELPDNTNWLGLVIPDADDTVLFGDVALSSELSVDLDGDREVLSLTFNRTLTGDYLLFDDSTTGTLTLGTGDITVLAGDPTIAASVDIDLSALGNWSVADGSKLTVAGAVTSTDRLDHNALGAVEFTGVGSNVTGLRALGGGTVDLNGATFTLTETTLSSLIVNHGSELIIRGGSTVTMPSVGTTTTNAGRGQVLKTSTLWVTGSGSLLTGSRLEIGPNAGNDSLTVVEKSAMLDITSGSDALLLIGDQANSQGTLTVQTGGDVQASTVTIANLTDSIGTLTVNGTGSTLTAGDITLGGTDTAAGGTGTLNIDDGGQVSVTGTTKLWSGGAINLDGGILTTGSFDNSELGTLNFNDGQLIVNGAG